MIETTRKASRDWGFHFIDFDDPRQGIAHVVAPEQGIAFPGATLVCCDSHTSTVGGVGALAWGIGASEAEHVLATQALAQSRPKKMRVNFDGQLRDGVYAKDMILALIGQIGAQGGIGYATEFAGSAIRSMPIEGRLTICNMSIEFSCKYGFVPPDDTTIEFLAGREFSPKGTAWDKAETYWRTLRTDEGAEFDLEVTVDCDRLQPQVTWGISPQQVTSIDGRVPEPAEAADSEARSLAEKALAYMQLEPGHAAAGALHRRGLYRLVHQRAPLGPARRSRSAQGAQGEARRAGGLRTGFYAREARRRGRGPRPHLPATRASNGTSRRAASAAASAITASPTFASSARRIATSRAARDRRRARISRVRPPWRPRPSRVASRTRGSLANGSAAPVSPASRRR